MEAQILEHKVLAALEAGALLLTLPLLLALQILVAVGAVVTLLLALLAVAAL